MARTPRATLASKAETLLAAATTDPPQIDPPLRRGRLAAAAPTPAPAPTSTKQTTAVDKRNRASKSGRGAVPSPPKRRRGRPAAADLNRVDGSFRVSKRIASNTKAKTKVKSAPSTATAAAVATWYIEHATRSTTAKKHAQAQDPEVSAEARRSSMEHRTGNTKKSSPVPVPKSPERKTRDSRVTKAERKERNPRKKGLIKIHVPDRFADEIIAELEHLKDIVRQSHAELYGDTEMSGTDEESRLTEDEQSQLTEDEDIEMSNMDYVQRPFKADVRADGDVVMPDEPQSPIYDEKMELDSPRPVKRHIQFVQGQTLPVAMTPDTAAQMWQHIKNQDNVNVVAPGQFTEGRPLATTAAAAAQNHWASYQYWGCHGDVNMGDASNVNVQAPATQHWGFSNYRGSDNGINMGATDNAPVPYSTDNDVAMNGSPQGVSTQWHVPGGACSATAPADHDAEMDVEDRAHGLSTQWPVAAHGFPAAGSADNGVRIKVEEPEDLPASQWAAPAQASSTVGPTGLQMQGFGQFQAYSEPSSTYTSLFPTAQPGGDNAGAASSAQHNRSSNDGNGLPVIKEEEEEEEQEEYDPEWLSSVLNTNDSSQTSVRDQLFPTLAAPAPAAQQYEYDSVTEYGDDDADMDEY